MSSVFHSPLVSVIVPVYNTERYLDEAVQSVLAQTVSSWELLLIDDGSNDGSGKICDRYMARDQRIRVFHTPNRGCGAARNLGLRCALGEWTAFLDSDDCLAPFALQRMLDQSEGADLVMALYQTFPKQTGGQGKACGGSFSSAAELGSVLTELYEPYFFLSAAAKLFRRQRTGKGFASELGPLCDWLYTFQVLPSCRGIRFVPETVYYYRCADHISVCSRFHSEWLYISRLVYERAAELFPGRKEIEEYLAGRYADRVSQHLTALASLKTVNRLQKMAMIDAERMDPFYRRPEILLAAGSGKRMAIWEAFVSGNSSAVLEAAEAVLQDGHHDEEVK